MNIINAWEHKGWGNNIYFSNFKKRRLVGWMTPIPQVGDDVHFKMRSGKIGIFKIIEIEAQGNPPDMFFATLKDIGYLEVEALNGN